MKSVNYSHRPAQNQTQGGLCIVGTFLVLRRTTGNSNSQDSPRPDLGEAITFPFIIYYVPLHEAHIQMAFCLGTPNLGVRKLPKLGLLQIWGPITLCANFQLKWGLKQSYSPCWEFFNDMSHATCTQGNRVDSQLLVVKSQIANLTPNHSFGHNLCFRCPNGSCEPSTFQ
jgi:hypothetical protein